MNVFESVRIALRSLSANKMRSILTMLGIIIGVMAVIAMMSIGRGAQATIINQIQSIGTNLLFIRPGATREAGVATAQGSAATLTLEDAEALIGLPDVIGVAPEVNGGAQIAYLGNNAQARLLGVTPGYLDIMNAQLANGEFVSDANITTRATVVVLGSQLATTLFSDLDPLGQNIRINNQTFRVIGVMAQRGGSGFANIDMQVYVPLTTATSRLLGRDRFRGQNNVNTVNVKITDPAVQDAVVQDISAVLRDRHRVQ
ncbi:MAG: ABC transporter permease, partial [Chloroflexi bacterium]|nr:ABC transporter permease [Chloroflexota bacterium]